MKYQICTSTLIYDDIDSYRPIVEMEHSLYPFGVAIPKGISYCHNSKQDAVNAIEILKKTLPSHYDFYIIEKY